MINELSRRLPIGAEFTPGHGVHFRVWAPERRRVEIILENENGSAITSVQLGAEREGYFSGWSEEALAGALYRYRLDGEGPFPDPASRCQSRGPFGPSKVVDSDAYRWQDGAWRGIGLRGQVIYEMHIGTYTREGTWRAAARHLEDLARIGVTLLEIMPICEFPGRFGWGYDVSNLYAPSHLYGTPDDFRRFVDEAHARGLGVILDVVYNHFGPDGNFLRRFSRDYFTDKYENEWGESINFDGTRSEAVREFIASNAAYWISEFHLDGLRLDATQDMQDESPEHIIAEIARTARAAAGKRSIVLTAENQKRNPKLVRPAEKNGYGLDALWNEDFQHSAAVALTGRRQGYFGGYQGKPQEFISSLRWGFLYQGQYYNWEEKPRGFPALDLAGPEMVSCLENHDQVANSIDGGRQHQNSHPGRHRALTALLLLGPHTPMLFQGQEFNASNPFLYFADHQGKLGRAVFLGRKKFLKQFHSLAHSRVKDFLPRPGDPATFERCKLDHAEREKNFRAVALHRDLLALRRDDRVFRRQQAQRIAGAVVGAEAFVLRFFDPEGDERLMAVNLGEDLPLSPGPEPLLAPPAPSGWEMFWSSDDPRYGGPGSYPPFDEKGEWLLPGNSVSLLRPVHG